MVSHRGASESIITIITSNVDLFQEYMSANTSLWSALPTAQYIVHVSLQYARSRTTLLYGSSYGSVQHLESTDRRSVLVSS